jgi:hypothetical protein
MFSNIIETFKKKISLTANYDPVTLPKLLHNNIREYLANNEDIKCSIKNYRAIHNADKWRDRNTFYNSWCILTDKRLLILRNLNYVKVFREIQVPKIDDYSIEKSDDNIMVKIITSGVEDRIEFSRYLIDHAVKFTDKFTNLVKTSKEKYIVDKQGRIKMKCPKCSKAISEEDKFCSNCGSSLV